jgi:alpha-glucosidase
MALLRFLLLLATSVVSASSLIPRDSSDPLASCPGYKASNVKTSNTGLTADLTLAGKACSVYGDDLTHLTLTVTYETGMCSLSNASNYPSIAYLTTYEEI